jgi:hypothetical protein
VDNDLSEELPAASLVELDVATLCEDDISHKERERESLANINSLIHVPCP